MALKDEIGEAKKNGLRRSPNLWAVGIFAAIIAGAGIIGYPLAKKHRMSRMVKQGDLRIDQSKHDWDFNKDGLSMETFIRNTGNRDFNGKLVFQVALDEGKLDENFMSGLVKERGDRDSLLGEMRQAEENGELHAKMKAMLLFLKRGGKTLNGKNYEIINSSAAENYIFKIRKPASIHAGEIVKFEHFQQLPPHKWGFLPTIEIAGVE